MNCTRCGKASRVVDTRQPDNSGGVYNGRIRKAGEVASWYTSDIVVARRAASAEAEGEGGVVHLEWCACYPQRAPAP